MKPTMSKSTGLDEYVANDGKKVTVRMSDGKLVICTIVDETPLYYVAKTGTATYLLYKSAIAYIMTESTDGFDI